MTENPYRPPQSTQEPHRPDDIPGLIRFREFRVKPISFTFSSRKCMLQLREEVEAFINTHVGPENVVNVAEHTGFEYAITVWYRTKNETA